MSLDEEDKDALIKALTKAIAAYEENRKLKKFIKEKMGIDVEEEKKPKKKRNTQKTQQPVKQKKGRSRQQTLSPEDIPETGWDELTEGGFDEKLDKMIEETEEGTEEVSEEEGEDNG